MGQKNYFPIIGAQYPGAQLIAGSFVCNGAAAPVSIFPARNAKFTVGAPTVGRYTITLTDGPISGGFIAANIQLADPAANSTKRALLTDVLGLLTNGTFQIQTQSAVGTDANLAGAVVAMFELWLSESVLGAI